jgi:hypothetical protein
LVLKGKHLLIYKIFFKKVDTQNYFYAKQKLSYTITNSVKCVLASLIGGGGGRIASIL